LGGLLLLSRETRRHAGRFHWRAAKLIANRAWFDDATEFRGPALVDGSSIYAILILDLLDPSRIDPEPLEIARIRNPRRIGIKFRIR
jgi:hypothetical protein